MTDITIYHNPACGTSRNTLALIRNSGAEPTVILYLETPPSRDELKKLIADMGIGVRDLLRKNTEPYEQLGLAEDRFSNDELLDAMAFSRGRFVIEQAGAPTLVVPAYPEVGRVIEDCR